MSAMLHLSYSPKANALDWNTPFLWDRDANTMCGATENVGGERRCEVCQLLLAFAIGNGWARGISNRIATAIQKDGEEVGFDLFKPMTPARIRKAMKEAA